MPRRLLSQLEFSVAIQRLYNFCAYRLIVVKASQADFAGTGLPVRFIPCGKHDRLWHRAIHLAPKLNLCDEADAAEV